MRVLGRLVTAALSATLLAGCAGTQEAAPSPTPSLASPSSAESAADEAAAVRQAFTSYTQAALEKDGARAVQHLASSIYAFYDQARRDALTAVEVDVRGQTIAAQLTVFTMRGSLDPTLLRSATPPELVVAAIDAGLVGEQGIQNTQLGEVAVVGDTASAPVLSAGQPSGIRFNFVREEGAWKLDLLPLLQTANVAFRNLATEQGITVDQLIDQTLEALYGPAKAQQVLSPIGA
jgi:hypothetical protein